MEVLVIDSEELSPLDQVALHNANSSAELILQLIAVREAAGLTQAQVGARMGVSQPSIASFEAYYNDPKLSTIKRYALAVGAKITFEVEGHPELGNAEN